LRLYFFGTFEQWKRDNNIIEGDCNDYIVNYKDELIEIASKVKEEIPILYESCRKSKEAKNKLITMALYYLLIHKTTKNKL
jgi:hypothetical protein